MKKERPWRRGNTQQFVEKAKSVTKHTGKYDYSCVDYKFNDVKVDIRCLTHGVFSMTPANHLSGQGCPRCGDSANGISQRKSTEQFIQEARSRFGDEYDYSNVVYTTCHTKVEIICKKHSVFKKSPAKHLAGQGCPCCTKSGFKKDKPANLYVLAIDNLTKIGITNREVQERVRTIKKSSGKKFEVLHCYKFSEGAQASDLEDHLLAELSCRYNRPDEKFDGSTETFVDVDRQEVLRIIAEYSAQTKEQNSSPHASQEAQHN